MFEFALMWLVVFGFIACLGVVETLVIVMGRAFGRIADRMAGVLVRRS